MSRWKTWGAATALGDAVSACAALAFGAFLAAHVDLRTRAASDRVTEIVASAPAISPEPDSVGHAELAQACFGNHWDDLTADQRAEVTALIDLIVRAQFRRAASFDRSADVIHEGVSFAEMYYVQ